MWIEIFFNESIKSSRDFGNVFLAKLKKENPENYKKLKKLTILPKFADLKKIPTEIHDKSVDKVILC